MKQSWLQWKREPRFEALDPGHGGVGEVDKEVANKWEGDKDTPRVDAALLGMVNMSSSPIMELREGQPRDLEERTVRGGGCGKVEEEGKWVSCKQGRVGNRLKDVTVASELELDETTSAYSGSEFESNVELR